MVIVAKGLVKKIVYNDGGAMFVLAEETGHEYRVTTNQPEIVNKVRLVDQLKEPVVLVGDGRSFYWATCKHHHFSIVASFLCPVRELPGYDDWLSQVTGDISQIMKTKLLSI